jgi:hypothetical protein
VLPWPALPPAPAAEPAAFQAERLESGPEGGRADALELTLAPWRWRVRSVRWPAPGSTCADAWALEGVTATGPDATLDADRAQVCGDGAGEVAGLVLQGPLFVVKAETASWSEADGVPHVRATAARFTRCRCADPPWEVRADTLALDDATSVSATWPTLRLGGVPVMAAPAWEFPLEARRAGVLPPELAWRGEDGPAGRLPLFLPLGRSADLTPAPGYETGAGPTGSARLRWRTDPRRDGRLTVAGDPRGLEVEGAGSADFGAPQLALEGRFASSERLHTAHARAPASALAPSTALRPTASIGSERLAAVVRAPLVRDHRSGEVHWMPAAHLGVATLAGPVQLAAEADEQFARGDGADASRLTAGVTADTETWFGPVRAGLSGRQRTIARQGTGGESTTIAGVVEGVTALGAQRAFGDARHRVDAALHGAHGAAGTSGAAVPSPDPLDTAREVSIAWATLGSTLVGSTASLTVVGAWGRDFARAGSDWPWFTLDAHAPWVAVDAAFAEGDTVGVRTRVGPDALGVRAGYTRLDTAGATPLLVAANPAALQLPRGDAAAGQTLLPGLEFVVGPLTASWDVALALGPSRFLGHVGDLRWQGRCACWTAGLHVEQARPAKWPDAWLSVSLE